MEDHLIIGIHVMNRTKDAETVQHLLTEYGCNIKTRLGLHHVAPDACSPSGIILLEMFGDQAKCNELADKLNAIDGVEAQQMCFGH